MQAISKVEGKVSCIPYNTDKYILFSLGQLRFIDSAKFLLASLDKLVAANRPEAFQITVQFEPNEARCKLILRKGVYPYEYMDSWVRFEETQLPSKDKDAFYSKLSDENINEADYAHARQVWTTFVCKTLGDYSDLYCRTEVLLLADVFETFGGPAKSSTAWARLTTSPARVSPGTPCSRRHALSYSCLQATTSIYSLRWACVWVYLPSQSAMPKPTILCSRATTKKSLVATSSILTRTNSMVGL